MIGNFVSLHAPINRYMVMKQKAYM